MDTDALRHLILADVVITTKHGYDRLLQRLLPWDMIRVSYLRGYDVVERYPRARPKPAVLLLTRTSDGRPLYTIWCWDQIDRPELVTVYRPDDPQHRGKWTNGYRVRKGQP